ncbi:hypothetical protein HDU96_003070 [Phlyctochytrium bullatum]|nr:hypothetical protein HDU96_003070 [Phlyctochytrium bullatum]
MQGKRKKRQAEDYAYQFGESAKDATVTEARAFWNVANNTQALRRILSSAATLRHDADSSHSLATAFSALKNRLGFSFPTPPIRERLLYLEQESKSAKLKPRALHLLQCPSGKHIGLDGQTPTGIIGSKFAEFCIEMDAPFELLEACPVCPRLAPDVHEVGLCLGDSSMEEEETMLATKKTVQQQ